MKDRLKSAEEGAGADQLVGEMPFTFRIKNENVRVGLAETLGTYVMMVFGLGSVAQVVTGGGVFGDYLSINLGFGLGVAMGVHIAGKVSGAHMNAAVSFAMCLFGRLSWKMLPLYLAAQMLASFSAAGTIYSLYYGYGRHLCNLPCALPLHTCRIPGSGAGDSHAAGLPHGSVGPEEPAGPAWQRTPGCGTSCTSNRGLSGEQQRLCHQPIP